MMYIKCVQGSVWLAELAGWHRNGWCERSICKRWREFVVTCRVEVSAADGAMPGCGFFVLSAEWEDWGAGVSAWLVAGCCELLGRALDVGCCPVRLSAGRGWWPFRCWWSAGWVWVRSTFVVASFYLRSAGRRMGPVSACLLPVWKGRRRRQWRREGEPAAAVGGTTGGGGGDVEGAAQ